ncbi:MAG: LysM peptidoglycan-binding domain-containing protein [Acidimicrobiales bacterium]
MVAHRYAGGARGAGRQWRFFWRRLLVLGGVAAATASAWGGAERLSQAGAPEPASAAVCAPHAYQRQVVVLAAATGLPARLGVGGGAPGTCPQVYVARPGDTIWGIAERYSSGRDPRPLADDLESQIGGAVLQPGQRLSVP